MIPGKIKTKVSGWIDSAKGYVSDIFEKAKTVFKKSDSEVSSRPTWRESEIDVGKDYPDYQSQASFKDGKEVEYSTKDSSRQSITLAIIVLKLKIIILNQAVELIIYQTMYRNK